MKKILFIGAGEFQIDGIRRANELGFHTIAIDGDSEAVGKIEADEFYNINVKCNNEILELARDNMVDGCVAIASEVSMGAMAYVNSKMGLNGYPSELIEIAHDKKKYYSLFEKNKIKVPKTIVFKDNGALAKLDKNKSYIIKPSKGSGSRGVKRSNNIHNFNFDDYHIAYIGKEEEIIIQELIIGKEMTVDGFIIDKNFHLLAVSEEMNDLEKGYTFSSELVFPPEWIEPKNYKNIVAICNQVVDSLNINCTGPMHLEFILTPDGEYFIIDFSLRGGGFDVFTKIIEKTSNVNILDLYILSSLGEEVPSPITTHFNPVTLSFLYPEKAGKIKKINGIELEGKHKDYYLKFLHSVNMYISEPESGKQRYAYFICWGKNYQDIFKRRAWVKEQISLEIDDE